MLTQSNAEEIPGQNSPPQRTGIKRLKLWNKLLIVLNHDKDWSKNDFI